MNSLSINLIGSGARTICRHELTISWNGGELAFFAPNWIQSAESPSCEKCSAKMQFVLQLAGDVEFGDSGLAYVDQCATHPDQFAMGWSST